ncbi:hypothetical protein [Nitrosopumilus sp.]|uniref:hypothetical protein n=1 Tax=Nitrosopumilus sp. TaxID=2024843 RepID=UPI00292FFA56|nr:hypothetical protein [Nitrosopumilus sp.]
MSRKKITVSVGTMLSIMGMTVLLLLPSAGSGIPAYAQYLPDQTGEEHTGLGDYLKLSEERVRIASENPHTGSGTPMFAVDGVLGALVLSTGVFGGIAVTFFVMGTKGKYAAIGRG